mgnify:CR=1 FL=1
MIKVLKIKGDSLYPQYKNGDFVIIARSPFLFGKIKVGDVIAFHHDQYGMMIKKVVKIQGNGYDVRGSMVESIDSRQLGLIPFESVLGKVIWHIRQ